MSWEEGFKSAVRQGRRGWNVANNNGRMQLKLRGKFLPIAPQTANLPFPWHPNKQADALLLINRVYGSVMDRKQSLKQSIIDVLKSFELPFYEGNCIVDYEEKVITNEYNYLLNLSVYSFTLEKVEELKETILKNKNEFDELEKKDIKDIWKEELDIFEQSYKKM